MLRTKQNAECPFEFLGRPNPRFELIRARQKNYVRLWILTIFFLASSIMDLGCSLAFHLNGLKREWASVPCQSNWLFLQCVTSNKNRIETRSDNLPSAWVKVLDIRNGLYSEEDSKIILLRRLRFTLTIYVSVVYRIWASSGLSRGCRVCFRHQDHRQISGRHDPNSTIMVNYTRFYNLVV